MGPFCLLRVLTHLAQGLELLLQTENRPSTYVAHQVAVSLHDFRVIDVDRLSEIPAYRLECRVNTRPILETETLTTWRQISVLSAKLTSCTKDEGYAVPT